ncbi:fibroblast growth factor receptor 3-like isoform X2 [Mizuhopecten yessoensis]|uniref:fibroblast growth factor receptor 3-like isoform X2 n=1 Tax=Mizuhopecten yessoensis TaxID=6573 RepID=UPI000B459132|nr:fibroblast growth factor receptor 3-like isoform X2 [Mizuhopecten yessoensis]
MTYRVVVLGIAIVLVCGRRRAGGATGDDGENIPFLKVTDPDTMEYRVDNGTNVTITCTGRNLGSDYKVGWSVKTRVGLKTITSAAEKTPYDPNKYLVSSSLSSDGDKFLLTVTSVTQEDTGMYMCSTFHGGRMLEGAVKVVIEDIPFLEMSPHKLSALIGNDTSLSCGAIAVPPIQKIVWKRNNEIITNGTDDRFFISNRGIAVIVSRLLILNVTSNDETIYTCVFTNDKGSSSKNVSLQTLTNISMENFPSSDMSGGKTAKIIEPSPYFSNVVVQGTLRVTCLVTGFPHQPMKMNWIILSFVGNHVLRIQDSEERRYDGVTISTYVMENSTGFYYNLMYNPVMYNNTGSYTCEVPHHNGVSKDSINITVTGTPVVVAPKLSTYGLLEQELVLKCSIFATPAPTLVLWYFEDKLLSASSRISHSLTSVNSVEKNATLTIHSLTMNDFGTYTCKAYNSKGYGMAVQVIQDVDECSFDHGCDHDCINGLGTHTCTCGNGYKLNADGQTCEDVNECQLTEKVACEQECTNYNGSFVCSCHPGWVLDDNDKTCTNMNDESGEGDDEAIEAEEIYSIIGATSGALLIIILLILCVVWCRRRKEEEEMPMKAVYSVNTGYSGSSTDMSMTKYHSTNTKDTKITPADEFPRQRLQLGIDLGQGRFGKVMMARALNVSGIGKWEMVAVKTCRDSASDLEKEDLYQELEIMRSIDKHPNIVSYLGCCTKQDPLYILMEYVPGGNLQTQLRKCRPSHLATTSEEVTTPTVKELETHALHIAKGMVYLSSIGIIHRDLAARNILVGPNRVCKICDFGLARDVEGSDMYERTSKGPSPIRWMAPESLSDQCFTRKSDVWSFGVLFWEIVTLGATPYPGMTAREVIKTVLIGKWLQRPLHCKQELYSMMTRCWDMEPKERPSFSEIAKELEVFIECETDNITLDELEESQYGVLDPNMVDERV